MEKAEYVDRIAIREKVCTGCTMWVDGVCRDADPCEKLIAGILEAPAEDVAPVRHAKWEECHWVEPDGPYSLVAYPKAAFRCSGCKYVFKKELLWKNNYCPNCGARMDIEESGGAVFK